MNRILADLHQKTKLAKVKRKVGKYTFEVELLSDGQTFQVTAETEQFKEEGVASPTEMEKAFDDFFDHVLRSTRIKLDIGRLYGNANELYCKFRFEQDSLLKQI